MKTRAIEIYLGVGSDFGTWGTEYVDIPVDTPEGQIEQKARDQARAEGYEFVICGVYCIPPLDDQPYEDEEEISKCCEATVEYKMHDLDGTNLEELPTCSECGEVCNF